MSLPLKINFTFSSLCLLASFTKFTQVLRPSGRVYVDRMPPPAAALWTRSANCVTHRKWEPPSERRLKSELMKPLGDHVAMATVL